MTKKLTEKQEKFLHYLFHDAKGNAAKAKKLAGYSENVATQQVVDSVEEEIYNLTKKYIANTGVKAAIAVSDIIDDPTALGNRDRLAASKDILDRAGFKPSDKVEVETKDPVFILPPKGKSDAETED